MRAALLALAFVATPARAEIKTLRDSGFAVERVVSVPAPPATAWDAVIHPARWWNGQHSWSGSAVNLSIDPRAGGCFCERWPAGSVEHGRVIFAQPGKLLRLSAPLGPLQGEAVTTVLSFTLVAEGKGTRITVSYVVGGFARPGMLTLAPAVDGVISEQADRLAASLRK